jgi:hypothetical protein
VSSVCARIAGVHRGGGQVSRLLERAFLLRTRFGAAARKTRPSLFRLRYADGLLGHRFFGALITALATRQDIRARKLMPLRTLKALRNDPMEKMLPNEPMEPIEKLDPIDPMEKLDR